MTKSKTGAEAAVWSTFREAPLAAKTVLAGIFISRLAGFLNIFLVLYLTSQGYSSTQASIALGVYGGGVVLGVLIGGTLSERLGARNTTVVSMASSSLMLAGLLYLPNYGSILVAVALAGLAGQMFRPAATALLSQLTDDDRQVMIFAIYRFGLNLGAMAAPLIGYALYNAGGDSYTLLFWGEACAALAYAVLAWTTLPARAASGEADEEERGSYAAMLGDRRYVFYLIAILVHSAVYVQYLSTLPLNVTEAGVSVFWYTLAVALNGFMVIAFELPLTKRTQTWPFRLTIGIAFLTLAGGVAFYGLPMGPAVIMAGTLIWSLGEIIGGPAIFAYPAVSAPAHLKSRYIAGFHFVFALGSALGPMAGGWLFAELGHRVWPVLALGSLIATTFAMVAVRSPKGVPDPAGESRSEPAADASAA
ncbi:MFS transporter [Streptomyces sp. NPDC005775]|uniref:MFS transporter n=1 Tax=unclassified Streptomyces TaxID=2593676 RepID=UPI0033E760C1